MKKIILFAVLFCGCLPQQKLSGRLIDTSGPVADAAVLGMIWMEDADKALPAPETNGITPEDRDAALDKDMAARGLPVAYSRAFSDKAGQFSLEKLHFSAATTQAIKGMKQPQISRVTLWAFQRGYRKQAVTLFPRQGNKEVSPATLLLLKSADWKELYRDNTVDTLTQNFMVKGFSKEFGATEQEKRWLLEYTHSNLWKAYVDSDIKGDKEMTELCGRDYSGVTVSTAGIAWNQEHERCGELKQRMGAVRDIEELWIAHANKSGDVLAAAKEVVRRAIAQLPAEASEPKEYEGMILSGIEDAANAKAKGAVLTPNPGISLEEEAKLQYGKGDKASAYRAMGNTIYTHMPEEIKQGELTAQLAARTIPGIRETAAGFYLLMNRPVTAQLPGGDGGNHKDTAKSEIEKSTETKTGEDSRVILAENEIVILQDEIEIRRELVPAGSKKADRIYAEVKAKKNSGEKLSIEEHTLKEPKLLFYDKLGKLTKELKLGGKGGEILRKKHPLLKSERPIQSTFKSKAWVSGNEKRALYVESVKEYELENDEATQRLFLGTTSNYKYYSSDGLLLFEKHLPAAYSVWDAAISENGKVVVVVNSCEIPDWDCPGSGEEKDSLIVYDETGGKLVGHPSALTDLDISPNGKYLSACRGDEIFFFNTENKKVWKTELELAVRDIDNNGKARLSKSQGEGKKPLRIDLDLTIYLGD